MELWHDDTGRINPEAGSGDPVDPVVLLHPGIHDSTIWDGVLPLLADHRLVRFDLRGFGRTPVATEEFANWRDVVAGLDELGLQRVHLVGNSMGGAAALSIALERPERVASLTLLATAIEGYPWPEATDPERIAFEADWNARSETAQEARDAVAMGALLGELFCAAGIDESVATQLTRSSEADFAQEELEQDNPEHWSRVAGLRIPVTVVVGELDDPDFTSAGAALADRIPQAELVRLPEADHLIPLRSPEATAQAIRSTIGR